MNHKGIVFLSSDFPPVMSRQLALDGWEIINVAFCKQVMPSLGGHPELQLFIVNSCEIVVHPDMPDSFIDIIQKKFERIIIGSKKISEKYPYDIAYNGKIIGDTFFHKLEYTDPVLLRRITLAGYKLADVNQGYTGCSVLPVGLGALITADIGIAKRAGFLGFDVLLINPGFIRLRGLNHGFIGGASSWDQADKIYFCGNINLHPDAVKIKQFITGYGIQIVNLTDTELTDFGSLIFVPEKL